jgi:hypothetical protein
MWTTLKSKENFQRWSDNFMMLANRLGIPRAKDESIDPEMLEEREPYDELKRRILSSIDEPLQQIARGADNGPDCDPFTMKERLRMYLFPAITSREEKEKENSTNLGRIQTGTPDIFQCRARLHTTTTVKEEGPREGPKGNDGDSPKQNPGKPPGTNVILSQRGKKPILSQMGKKVKMSEEGKENRPGNHTPRREDTTFGINENTRFHDFAETGFLSENQIQPLQREIMERRTEFGIPKNLVPNMGKIITKEQIQLATPKSQPETAEFKTPNILFLNTGNFITEEQVQLATRKSQPEMAELDHPPKITENEGEKVVLPPQISTQTDEVFRLIKEWSPPDHLTLVSRKPQPHVIHHASDEGAMWRQARTYGL